MILRSLDCAETENCSFNDSQQLCRFQHDILTKKHKNGIHSLFVQCFQCSVKIGVFLGIS